MRHSLGLLLSGVVFSVWILVDRANVAAQDPESKSVTMIVVPFEDNRDGDLGLSMAHLLLGELALELNQDTRFGLEVSTSPQFVKELGSQYHVGAARIAESEGAALIAWGAAAELEEERVAFQTYLTISDKEAAKASVVGVPFVGWLNLVADIPRSRFSFPPQELFRRDLFARFVIVPPNTKLYPKPDAGARYSNTVKVSKVLRSINMQGAWFRVQDGSEPDQYVHASGVTVVPKAVRVTSGEIVEQPGEGFGKRVSADLELEVKDVSLSSDREVWYYVDNDEVHGWISEDEVDPVMSFPIAQFVLGYLGHIVRDEKMVSQQYSRFLMFPPERAGYVNEATAHQLIGLSALPANNEDEAKSAIRHFEMAAEKMPFDPVGQNLVALAGLSNRENKDQVLLSLDRALELEPGNPRSRDLVRRLDESTIFAGYDLDNLRQKYRIGDEVTTLAVDQIDDSLFRSIARAINQMANKDADTEVEIVFRVPSEVARASGEYWGLEQFGAARDIAKNVADGTGLRTDQVRWSVLPEPGEQQKHVLVYAFSS